MIVLNGISITLPYLYKQQFLFPTQPGYYQVRGSISGCNSPPVLSDLIPVSTCETDTDLDTVNDNMISIMTKTVFCTESYGIKL
jgi:hypothetical protein